MSVALRIGIFFNFGGKEDKGERIWGVRMLVGNFMISSMDCIELDYSIHLIPRNYHRFGLLSINSFLGLKGKYS